MDRYVATFSVLIDPFCFSLFEDDVGFASPFSWTSLVVGAREEIHHTIVSLSSESSGLLGPTMGMS